MKSLTRPPRTNTDLNLAQVLVQQLLHVFHTSFINVLYSFLAAFEVSYILEANLIIMATVDSLDVIT